MMKYLLILLLLFTTVITQATEVPKCGSRVEYGMVLMTQTIVNNIVGRVYVRPDEINNMYFQGIPIIPGYIYAYGRLLSNCWLFAPNSGARTALYVWMKESFGEPNISDDGQNWVWNDHVHGITTLLGRNTEHNAIIFVCQQ